MNEQIRKITNEIFSMEEFEYAEEFLNDEFMEKFAELVIRECAKVSENYAGGSMPLSIALAIKQHFGVKQ